MKNKYRIISSAYIVIKSMVVIMNFIEMFLNVAQCGITKICFEIVANIAILLALIFTFYDFHIARYVQPFSLIFESYFAFVVCGVDMFLGWGLFLMGIILGYEYGIWKKNSRIKLLFVAISFVLTMVFRGFAYDDFMHTFLFGCIFMTSIIFFSMVIYRNHLEILFEIRQDFNNIVNELIEKQNDLIDLREQLETVENKVERTDVKNLINESISSITADRKILQKGISNIPGLANLSDVDLSMLVSFYISKGNMTNKELASEIQKDENYVKNHLRAIYHSLPDVKSRASLWAYISSYLGYKD